VGEKQTLGQYLASWLKMIEPTIDPRTFVRYEILVRVHIVPKLGNTSLAKLGPQQVQTLYAEKLAEGLARATVVMIHAVLHRALETAVRMDLVLRNVAKRSDVPKKRSVAMQVLTPEQVSTFLVAIVESRFEALYVLAVTTGMRQGELLALKWDSIDLDRATLEVRATVKKVYGKFIFTVPKTERSRRKVALTTLAVEALRRHRAKQHAERLVLGPAWHDEGLVFPNKIGKVMDRIDLVRRDYLPLLAQAGLPSLRFHDLRHTAATMLLRQGIHPKVVSELLGHSQIAITLDTYSHVLPDMQREATVALDRLLGGKRG
jgi:integrase